MEREDHRSADPAPATASRERRSADPARGTASRERIDPIYRRLPRGPHGLGAAAIRAHQRARIQGALVRAVERGGYEGLTVREVIALAGVSRRSFYEQFGNRHDCFLRTARALSERGLADARRACAEQPRRGPSAAIAALTAAAAADPPAARLVLVETLAAGDTGAALRGELLGSAARMLRAGLPPAGRGLPAPALRVLAGLLAAMLEPPSEGHPAAPDAAHMSSLLFAAVPPAGCPAADVLACGMQAGLQRAAGRPPVARSSAAREPAARIMSSALTLAARQPVQRLSVPQIADTAGVPVDAVMSGFGGPEACVERALEEAARRTLAVAETAVATAGCGAQSVRLALGAVLGHLAANPEQARGIALVAHRSGARARAGADRFRGGLGAALLRGAPAGSPPPAAAGEALMDLVRQALLEGRERLLPALADPAAYVLLAPGLGAERSLQALSAGARGARRSA